MDQTVILVFNLAVLILSVVIHEVSHGLMANRLGDPTAKDLGRLSFNPLKHLDFMGSFLVPLLLYVSRVGIIFGWAKPVPYNPYNLKNQKWGPAWGAAAGPASNFIVAIVFGLVLRFVSAIPFATALAVSVIVYINILLGVFNLVPIPPLDGSKILAGFLPYRYERQLLMLERWGMFLVILFIFFLFPLLSPVIPFMFRFITGSSFMF